MSESFSAFREQYSEARFDGRGLETERHGVTAPAPDPTNLGWASFSVCTPDERAKHWS